PCRGPHVSRAGHVGAAAPRALQKTATAPPGRDERLGGLGAISRPPCKSSGPFRGPNTTRATEERPGFAGARRTSGGFGGPCRGPPCNQCPVCGRLRTGRKRVMNQRRLRTKRGRNPAVVAG